MEKKFGEINLELFVSIFLMVVVADILTIIFIVKDDRYFFDDEKRKLVFLVILLPILGFIYVLTKLRDDIKWYVGLAGFMLVMLCSSGFNRWDWYFCTKILSRLGKLLS